MSIPLKVLINELSKIIIGEVNPLQGPRTNFFMGVRYRLSALESSQLMSAIEAKIGFLAAFVASAFAALLIGLALNNAVTPAFSDPQIVWIPPVILAPMFEETAKTLCMLFILYTVMSWMIPNRRYGAALGAMAGLGFGIAESIFRLQVISGGEALLRLFITPMAHPIWSAFVGIGVFVFAAEIRRGQHFVDALLGLPLVFFFMGILSHMIWNGLAIGLALGTGNPYVGVVLDILIIFPLSAIILRDFLGGHFNFQNFFQQLPEPYLTRVYIPRITAPPSMATIPSSPTTRVCPTCKTVNNPGARFCRKCGRIL